MKMPELKHCPFCGAEADVDVWGTGESWDNYYRVSCTNKECFVHVSTDWCMDKNRVLKEWNRRVKDD